MSERLVFEQFYPKVWLGDTDLRRCSPAARSVWIDMLCTMWQAPGKHRGFLVGADGNLVPNKELCRTYGYTPGELVRGMEELKKNGVYSEDERGIPYCRYTVRMEKKRADARRRQRKLRDKQRDVTPDVAPNVTPDVTGRGKEEQSNRGKEVSPPTPPRFKPPTPEEVRAYCRERGNSVDAQRFVDFYASKGWLVGKAKMRDWKAAVRTWEKDDNATAKEPRYVAR